jgi:hypothetical protein
MPDHPGESSHQYYDEEDEGWDDDDYPWGYNDGHVSDYLGYSGDSDY